MKKNENINLTLVFKEDKQVGGFTSYFEELPGIVAEGNTIDEAQHKLFEALFFMLEVRREEFQKKQEEKDSSIIKRSVQLSTSY